MTIREIWIIIIAVLCINAQPLWQAIATDGTLTGKGWPGYELGVDTSGSSKLVTKYGVRSGAILNPLPYKEYVANLIQVTGTDTLSQYFVASNTLGLDSITSVRTLSGQYHISVPTDLFTANKYFVSYGLDQGNSHGLQVNISGTKDIYIYSWDKNDAYIDILGQMYIEIRVYN